MFTLLRSVAVIGLIFYFSPARQAGQPQREEDRNPAQALPAVEAEDGAWNRLVGTLKEEVVRTAVNDKALSDKALSAGLRESAARALGAVHRRIHLQFRAARRVGRSARVTHRDRPPRGATAAREED